MHATTSPVPGTRFGTEVCVLVPMYNEVTVVGPVIEELLEHFAHVVCVDDGSTDGSAAVARQAGARVLRHPVNLGAGAARLCPDEPPTAICAGRR